MEYQNNTGPINIHVYDELLHCLAPYKDSPDAPMLVLVQGVSGSGKSTLAKRLAEDFCMTHLEADNYFIDEDGEYKFDPEHLVYAHSMCVAQTAKVLRSKRPRVVVANTFATASSIRFYIRMSNILRLSRIIIIRLGDECRHKPVHNVGEQAIMKQQNNLKYNCAIQPTFLIKRPLFD